jgi:hypothetical protein
MAVAAVRDEAKSGGVEVPKVEEVKVAEIDETKFNRELVLTNIIEEVKPSPE